MAKITALQPNGTWNDFYKFEVTFDDGVTGVAFAKSNSPWYAIGDEVEYTISPKGGVKISKGVSQYAGGSTGGYSGGGSSKPDQSANIARSVAFKAAIDCVIAGKIGFDDVERFVNKYVPVLLAEAKQDNYKSHFDNAPAQAPAPPNRVGQLSDDDLPF